MKTLEKCKIRQFVPIFLCGFKRLLLPLHLKHKQLCKMNQIVPKIDARIIEKIVANQREELDYRRTRRYCYRQEVELVDLNSPQAQVVIGVRRSGKSTLCFQALEQAHINYAYADFDDERLRGITAMQLDDVLEVLYKCYGDFKHIFLDEIQNIEGWHLFVNRLLRMGMHVVVTGSNANLLSSELATHLTGRNKEIHLYPFSFAEYCAFKSVDVTSMSTKGVALRRKAFDDYMCEGGFPEKMSMDDSSAYVDDLTKNVLVRDIEQRHHVVHKDAFERISNHLLNICPTILSANDLTTMFNVKSKSTIGNYVQYLQEAFLLIEVQKYSYKSKIRMTQSKVYAVDVAMMNQRENAFAGDNVGWRLETIVLVELKRRARIKNLDIYYLKERSGECDFIVCRANKVLQCIQVSYDISNPKTLKRELNGLLLASKQTKCDNLLLLTDNINQETQVSGMTVKIQPVHEWCLDR